MSAQPDRSYDKPLRTVPAALPSGRWGVAVSGGADSVALLRLLAHRAGTRGDVNLVVIHLDHELRGADSTADAAFVADLAERMKLALWSRRRGDLEANIPDLPTNRSARLRRMRLGVYREAVEHFALDGVAVAHHADDVAETLLLRLLRGSPRSGTLGLAPMRSEQTVAGVRLVRPMLGVRRDRLRRWLTRIGQPWREDASNAQDVTLRNRLRRLLADRPAVTQALLHLAAEAAKTERVLEAMTPALPPVVTCEQVAALPAPLRRRAVRRWLVDGGVPEAEAGPGTVDRALRVLAPDGPRALDLPGDLRLVRRRQLAGLDRATQ